MGLVLSGCGGSAAPGRPPQPAAVETSSARTFAAGRWIDLTHPFDAATIYWPTEKGFQLERGDRAAYLGTAATGPAAVPQLRFPGLAPEAAKWLVEHRRVKAVGIDTASIDHGPATLFGSHVVLCGANVPILENVADLAAIPGWGAFVVALPMKIAGGSGGPLRILARLPD